MPCKLRLNNGKILVFADGEVSCADDPALAADLREAVPVGAEVPDPDLYRAEHVKARIPEAELFDVQPFNMQRKGLTI